MAGETDLIEAVKLLTRELAAHDARLEEFGMKVLSAVDEAQKLPDDTDPEDLVKVVIWLGDVVVQNLSAQRRVCDHCQTAAHLFRTHLEIER